MFYLYTNTDGSINLHYFSTREDRLKYIEEKNCTQYVMTETLGNSYFFSAFEWDESVNNIKVNINKAKEIRMNFFRQVRAEIFPKLDLLYMKSLESGNLDDQRRIVDDKNYLRNLSEIEMPDTEAELFTFFPERLMSLYNI
jgi:hypothetical protein